METALRPRNLGEILDRTAQLYREHFLLFAGIAAIYAGIAMVLNLIAIGLAEALRAFHLDVQLRWVVLLFSGFAFLLTILFGNVATAANNRAVAWVHLGEPAIIGGAYRSILPKLGRYLWLGVLKTFFAWTPLIVLYAGFIGTSLYFVSKGVLAHADSTPHAAGQIDPSLIAFIMIMGVIGLLMIPALIYGTMMALRYALAVPACIVENLKARQAIRRSIELSKGARGSIFVLCLLVGFIALALILFTQGFFIVYGFKHHHQIPVGLRILQQMIGFFTNTFVAPILATGITLFYYDQRVRKEGYDIEWMMQAAGLAAPEPQQNPGAAHE